LHRQQRRCIKGSRERGRRYGLDDVSDPSARERGSARMRLFTPAGHGRARRFYEREGWVPAGEEFHAAGPNLVLIEYRYAL
jgi:hypothetical protein